MLHTVIGIWDRKAGVFISLEPTPNKAVATRTLQELVNNNRDPNNPIAKWPEDYSLWELGTFDTESGVIEPLTKFVGKSKKEVPDKKLIVEAGDLKAQVN